MPLWRIFSSPETFSPAQRAGLAQAITDLYVNHIKLPAFYVNVLFIDIDGEHTYVGGVKKANFVRIVAEQIARQMPDPATEEGATYRRAWMDALNATLKPWISDRPELDWELHISETPRDLWRIQGLDAPPPHSEAEQIWRKANKPIPWEQGRTQS